MKGIRSSVAPRPTTGTARYARLLEVASAQDGFFTTLDARRAGYSGQLISYQLRAGKFERAIRGVYRLASFPNSLHASLLPFWLWSQREGVFSHTTALCLLDLCEEKPSQAQLTVPNAWRKRRLDKPDLLRLHYGDLELNEVTKLGAIPITTVRRTLSDCVAIGVRTEVVDGAVRLAVERRLLRPEDLSMVGLNGREFG